MSNHQQRPIADLAVSLVSGSDSIDSARVAAILSGVPATTAPREFDYPGSDSAGFAVELAEDLASDSRDGLTGNIAVVLESNTDVVEVALVLEHVLDAQQPRVPVGIRDVIAVSSVREILAALFVAPISRPAPEGGDLELPGSLARRLEFASVIVLTDVTEFDAQAEANLVRAFLAQLAPAAFVVAEAGLGAARPRPELLIRGRAHRLGASMGWQQQLNEGMQATGVRDVIGVHVFRDPLPFHTARLHAAIAQDLIPDRVGRIVRSRGFVRLATRPERVGAWSTAGDVLDLDPTTMLSVDPDSPIGQEIVFFGLDLNREALDAALTACLLSPSELADGPQSWFEYVDLFPEWTVHHRD